MQAKAIRAAGLLLAAALLSTGAAAQGQLRRIMPARPGAAATAGMVNLPYSVMDNTGTQWMFYQQGQFQQQGNMPVYSQAAMLQVNSMQPQSRTNQAKLDEKTGELIFEGMTAGNVGLTRRILINKEEGWIRYIDVLKNTQNQDQVVNLMYSTNTNYGVQFANMVADPRNKSQNIAWVATTHANGRVVVEMFAGKGAKSAPTFNYQQGNSMVQVSYSPTIPRGKEIAVMHFHCIVNTADAGQKFVVDMKEAKVMAGLPAAVRRLIVNFRGGENFIGDYEILRGDVLDVVELRTGDQLRGTLKEPSFKIQTFYGAVEMPVAKVVGLINAGEFRPRQLLVTQDGEIFGGKVEREAVSLELSSGQVMEIPVSQIARVGYRKRAGEPEEWALDKPMVLMRTGDRIGVQPPTTPIDVMTRYGLLKVKPETVAAINFQSEDHPVHEVLLTDGSRFAGLVMGESFEMKLGGGGPEQVVKFAPASMRRLQIAPAKAEERAEEAGTMALANEDVLVGSLAGTLKLDTAFSTMTINGGEVKRLVHTPAAPADVQVVLWDDTSVSGQLQDAMLACQLKSGLEVKVPVALVQEYTQPRPQPSPAALQIIKGLVADLNAEDWKARDAAQDRLMKMGPVVIGTLRQMRGEQSPEAQQRIDLVIRQIEKSEGGEDKTKPSAGAAPPTAPMVID